jgi:hypothetical protein
MSNKVLIELGKHIKEHLKNHREREAVRFDVELLWLLKERDTSDVWRQIAIWILVDPADGVKRLTAPGSEQYDAISNVAQLYTEDCKDIQAWEKAIDRASSAAQAGYAAGYAAGNAYGYTDAYYAARAATFAAKAAHAHYAARAATFAAKATDAHYYADKCHTYVAKCHSYVVSVKDAETARYDRNERMSYKLIKLLQAAPLINEKMINEQKRIIDDMDHSKEISFSISHHNGTKHIMRGKQAIEKHVRQIEYALSVVKALLKDNPSDAISINVGMADGTISVTYPSK